LHNLTFGQKSFLSGKEKERIELILRSRERCESFQRPGIIGVMATSSSRRFPVTVSRLPVTRCEICRRTVAYQPGSLSKVLTEHYERAHPEVLRTAAAR
jgi:hypothetical protein